MEKNIVIFLIKDGKVAKFPNATVDKLHLKLTKQGVGDYKLFNASTGELFEINSVTHMIKVNRSPERVVDLLINNNTEVFHKIHENLVANSPIFRMFHVAHFNNTVERIELSGWKEDLHLTLEIDNKYKTGLRVCADYSGKGGSPTQILLDYINYMPDLPDGYFHVDAKPRMANGQIATHEKIRDEGERYDDMGYTEYEFSNQLYFMVDVEPLKKSKPVEKDVELDKVNIDELVDKVLDFYANSNDHTKYDANFLQIFTEIWGKHDKLVKWQEEYDKSWSLKFETIQKLGAESSRQTERECNLYAWDRNDEQLFDIIAEIPNSLEIIYNFAEKNKIINN